MNKKLTTKQKITLYNIKFLKYHTDETSSKAKEVRSLNLGIENRNQKTQNIIDVLEEFKGIKADEQKKLIEDIRKKVLTISRTSHVIKMSTQSLETSTDELYDLLDDYENLVKDLDLTDE